MAHLVLFGTVLIWSFSFLAAARLRVDLGVAESLVARFLPVLVGAAALLAIRWPLKIPREAYSRIVLMGLLSVPAYNIFFFHGLKTVPTGTAALIVALNPVFTAILARIFLGESFGPRKLAGLVLALAGVFVVIRFGTDRVVDWPYLSSALLLVLSPLSWAVYTVIGRKLPEGTDPFDTTFALLVAGSLPLLVLVRPATFRILAARPATLASALFLAVGCTLIGYAGFLWALRRLPASEAAAFVFLNPPLANLWAWIFEGARLRPAFLVGAAVLLAGVAAIVLPLGSLFRRLRFAPPA